jgi:hypothetical protein
MSVDGGLLAAVSFARVHDFSSIHADQVKPGMPYLSSASCRRWLESATRHARLIAGLALGLAPWSPAAFAQVVNQDLWTTNGTVSAVVHSGGTTYIGGSFDFVGPVTGGGGPVSIWSGELDPSFPRVDGHVFAADSDGAGGWYIGGLFTAVDGISRSNVAHIASDLSVTAWNPGANSIVRALYVHGSRVYAGGDFTTIGGQSRSHIAALDATTGSATSWNPGANSTVYAIEVGVSTVYIGGFFTTLGGGTPRNYIAALDPATGNATAWNPNASGSVYSLPVSGSLVYAGGAFTNIGGQARNFIARIDATSGLATGWNPSANSTVHAVEVSGSTVYAGGFFTTIGGQSRTRIAALDAGTGSATSWNPGADSDVVALELGAGVVYAGGNFTNIGGQVRSRVAAIDATTGTATSWNPGAGARVDCIALSGEKVYVGGTLNTVGGKMRQNIAALDEATGAATAWNPNASGSVVALAMSGSTLYAGGSFTSIGGQTRNYIAALDLATGLATDWNPNASAGVLALAVSGSTVYAAGGFNSIGGQSRAKIAALNAAGSGLATSWNPSANSDVSALAVSGSTVYAGGYFTSIGGQARNYVAALDAGTGLATSWNPNPSSLVFALAPSGSLVYAGGSFTSIGGQARSSIAAIDATTGLATSWDPSASNTVFALAVNGSTVYAGGSFTNIGGQTRTYLAGLNATTGLATSWNVSFNNQINALALGGSKVYAGGWFTSAGGAPIRGIAAISALLGISRVHPNRGGDAGSVSVVISGVGFEGGATAKLTRSGQPAVVGTQVSVAPDGQSLTASFDLGGKALGLWDVVVTNPDLTFASLPNGFTIESLAAPQLRVDIIGPNRFRTGYSTAYDLVLQNSGNIDARAVPLWIAGIPTNATVKFDFPLSAVTQEGSEPDWTQLPDTLTGATGRFMALVIPRVPPGTTVRRIYLTVPSPGTFQLIAAITPPWVDGTQFRVCIAEGGIVSDTDCMGGQLNSINTVLAAQTTMQALDGIGVWAKIGWRCEGAASLPDALAEARQALELMLRPVEQSASIPARCSMVLPPPWREVLMVTVGSSFDPNDKLGNRGNESAITSQQILSYSIRFENLNSAAYPAQQVVVTDVLDNDLDPATVSLGTISFGPHRLYPPPGQSGYSASLDLRPSQNLIVHVNALLSGNTLNWYFTSADPNGQPLPPDAGFLPPNVNPPEGEGSVVFTVRPRSALPPNTQIANSAAITFDDNPPITTAAWLNTVDDSPPASQVQTLGSPQGAPTFTVSWAAPGPPGDLRDFTVCVSEDGGPYRPWRLNTTATTDTFAARSDDHQSHTYAFYSVARDQVGNMEAPPPVPDAQTTSTTDVGGSGQWRLALAGARPNPTVGAAHIWFTLPSSDPATLEMLDVAGRRVMRRDVGSLGPGPHMVMLDSSLGVKSGLYFLRLRQGEQELHGRVVLIR